MMSHPTGHTTTERYWFACWTCGCSDVEHDPDDIAERCPKHDRDLIHDNYGRAVVELDRRPISGMGYRNEQHDAEALPSSNRRSTP